MRNGDGEVRDGNLNERLYFVVPKTQDFDLIFAYLIQEGSMSVQHAKPNLRSNIRFFE